MEDRPEKQISPENIQTLLSEAQDKDPLPGDEQNSPESDQNPGYPHYPAQNDLLNPVNTSGRVDVDMDAIDPEDKNV